MPRYVVNATGAEQIARALEWAGRRGLRVVVKGTGHDLAGRWVTFVYIIYMLTC